MSVGLVASGSVACRAGCLRLGSMYNCNTLIHLHIYICIYIRKVYAYAADPWLCGRCFCVESCVVIDKTSGVDGNRKGEPKQSKGPGRQEDITREGMGGIGWAREESLGVKERVGEGERRGGFRQEKG